MNCMVLTQPMAGISSASPRPAAVRWNLSCSPGIRPANDAVTKPWSAKAVLTAIRPGRAAVLVAATVATAGSRASGYEGYQPTGLAPVRRSEQLEGDVGEQPGRSNTQWRLGGLHQPARSQSDDPLKQCQIVIHHALGSEARDRLITAVLSGQFR